MWAYETVFYQIYPLGFCGAPMPNDGVCVNRIAKVIDWIPHLKKLHVGAVYFSPVFESDNHGYDTRDYTKIDCRLGTNADFAAVCRALHENGIRVVLDGVFNHVGRGFFAFRDVQEKRWDSPYKDWFRIDFGGNSAYNDGFWYEGWEGHYELVKLNLQNPAVVDYLLGCVEGWIREFDVDGLRLDVAYMLDEGFMRRLRAFCDAKKQDFVLIGEMIHGDYNRITADGVLHSVTNYECYKGLYSAFNSMNLFEIAHSLGRQFGPEPWTLYRGKHLVNFADNHDVTRVASILTDKNQLVPLYGVLFAMPGIPCLYYGSEWGAEGEKHRGDNALRPCFERPEENALTEWIAKLAAVKRESRALNWGDYRNVTIQNKNLLFERKCPEETVFVAVNAENAPCSIDARGSFAALDLLTGETVQVDGRVELPPYGVRYLKQI
ncbi:MAG TPA: alpha-glucosidase C-terminal domain-containing protein [Candidatus Ruminococcus gallistercoris]|nr:alpha-glucosidase C-terminal domain-containing protein [Candidatus Ruminococcus gallistercoris]